MKLGLDMYMGNVVLIEVFIWLFTDLGFSLTRWLNEEVFWIWDGT